MRHALITAGTKGLGKKVTEMMLKKGYSVTATYRSDVEAVAAMKHQFEAFGSRLHFVQGDVTKKSDIVNMVEEVKRKYGRIDFLINNAGPYVFDRKKLVDYEPDEWADMIDGNLNAVFLLLKETIPLMRRQHFGRIITYGFQGAGNASGWLHRSAFAAAKVGLVSLTKTVAIEEAENGITANMVCPGDIIGQMKEADIADAKRTIDPSTPIGRSGTGEDIARLISFLCDEDSDLITGAVIEATGGVDVINRYR